VSGLCWRPAYTQKFRPDEYVAIIGLGCDQSGLLKGPKMEVGSMTIVFGPLEIHVKLQ